VPLVIYADTVMPFSVIFQCDPYYFVGTTTAGVTPKRLALRAKRRSSKVMNSVQWLLAKRCNESAKSKPSECNTKASAMRVHILDQREHSFWANVNDDSDVT
jgi:hypothetical protein